jgi:YYY domain-containing protein
MAVSFLRARPTAARRCALGLILLVAFVLRVWNLDWDQGTHQHPDERYWSIVTSDIEAVGPTDYFDSANSSLNPYNSGTEDNPRNTWVYGTFPLFTTKAAASFLADGPFPAGAIVTTANAVGIDLRDEGVDAFDANYNANLIGRVLSALMDTATVLMAYLLARDLFDRRAGFVAAILLTFTPLHIQYAHFYGAEPWVTFFVTAALLLSVKIARGNLTPRVVVGTGALLGLAMASKLIAIAALIVPAVAVLVAITPALANVGRDAWERIRGVGTKWVAGAVLGVLLILAAMLVVTPLTPKLAAAGLVGVSYLAIIGYVAAVVLPGNRNFDIAPVLYDQDGNPPQVVAAVHAEHAERADPPARHVLAWGAFSGGLIVLAAALTYRIFQPYTFDGVTSIDPRFSADLNYLEGVNAGGNVPWVVQWIGRTPLLFPLKSAFLWGMGPALGLAVVVGVLAAARAVVLRRRFDILVPLSLLAIMLGLVSQQFNPLIRYLLPAYPAAIVLGAFGVVTIWDAGTRALARPNARATLGGNGLRLIAGAMVALTAFWGLAFVNGIYNNEHPRIEASVWMAENLPNDAVLSTQIWDDALPLGVDGTQDFRFSQVAFDPFMPDAEEGKVEALIDGLDQVDYVVEASNRLYDSIPRIPAKYPATTEYYNALFDGRLGFEQVAQFRNAPSLFGITIADHNAEETFTVYDHPTVTIWQKTDSWSTERATAILNPAQTRAAANIIPADAGTNALQFTPDDDALTERGATFDETFNTDGIVGSVPWLFWLVWLQLSAIAVLPWTTRVFSRLPDRGYGLSKIVAFATVGLLTWLAVAWNVVDYSRGLTLTLFALTALVGLALWARDSDRMSALVSSHRRAWLSTEFVFMGIFALALWMRSANPDLWEAHLGGEKPMEMGYLTAIARSTDLPAIDPWFAGGFMNYYYVGWFLLTVPMRALRIVPEVAFNLGVATYAALTAAVAFSVVHNLVALSQRRWSGNRGTPSPGLPIRMGMLGVVFLMGIGNLDAIRLHYRRLELVNQWDLADGVPVIGHVVTFLGGSWAWATGTDLQRFDWWAPSRVNQGNFDITEFPYFTFLFGDLHPHMMGMVFVGLTVSVALAYLLSSDATDASRHESLVLAVGLGLCTGLVRMVNTWDLPSVMIVSVLAVVVGRSITQVTPMSRTGPARRTMLLIGSVAVAAGLSNWGGPGGLVFLALLAGGVVALVAAATAGRLGTRLTAILVHGSIVAAVHLLVFRPYLANSESIDTGIQSAAAGSPLDDFLVHWGIFLVLAIALALALMTDGRRRARTGEPSPGPLPPLLWAHPVAKGIWLGLALVALAVLATTSTGAATIALAGLIVFATLFLIEVRRADRDFGRIMATGLFALGFGIAGGVDIVSVENDIQRMNTVFKFWLQSWQYFALAGGFAIWQVARVAAERTVRTVDASGTTAVSFTPSRPWRANVWGLAVLALLAAGFAYPLLGTRTRLETRFAQIPATLDGMAYLDADPTIIRTDPFGGAEDITVSLSADLPLIDWLRANVEGTPSLVEWTGDGYDWNARMAIHTGLPTVLGWDWHQKQQRWDYHILVDQRRQDVQRFYQEATVDEVTTFLQAYGVSYVIVGTQEHRFALPESLAVIDAHPALRPVFRSGPNTIYQVDRGALWPALTPADLDHLALAD